ncbi:bifunctional riboflavin kinase/FAD synthetase [Hyphobacterium marinum]|uniref:Riboflavin biosynthesis protein n=1 Tax=Hyphobacterium marinum TaxID=3116574 RepID=A0ABU7LWM0_9PROT|nr:bifunctional riboflavin kinase/FAD synthetase [Hyphobacterium sp. Y6023]MEE2565948.1 bifunctional riboflavin kinase/FAD synthetase [Hyphobacterium sp. Y6023]
MDVLRGDTRPGDLRPSVLALGNFDGVHRGHRALLDEALDRARTSGLATAVAVFEPHPRRFFQPDAPPFRLMSDDRRNAIFAEMGFDRLHVLTFDADMAARTPKAFVADILNDRIAAREVVVGADFRFGKGRAGDFAALAELARARGMTAHAAGLVEAGGEKISSSAIRNAVAGGDMNATEAWLGRPFILDGVVEEGDRRGRTIGFPTANVALGDFVRPAHGVYAVSVRRPGDTQDMAGVANVGVRPTVDGKQERLEVHLFDFAGDLYGQTLAVSFHDHLRGEKKFDGLDALKNQIARDCEAARAVLAARESGPA